MTISATADDTASGGSAIKAAQWSFDSGATTSTALTVGNSGSIASLDATISQAQLATLAEGARTVYVRSQDSADNWGDWVSAELVVDKTAPTASSLAVTPNPSNGTVSVNSGVSAVRLSAVLTDQPGATVTSPITRGEAFVDTVGAVGTGIPLEAADGAFNAATENVYTDIPLATVRTMTNGTHPLYVRGRDAAGNWGPATSVNFLVDRAGPAVTATVSPSPTNGAATVTLTGTVTDALTAVASAEWFIGTDPGVGKGTSLTPNAAGAFSVTVNVNTLAEGTSTVTVRARDTLGNTTLLAKPLVLTPAPCGSPPPGASTPPGSRGRPTTPTSTAGGTTTASAAALTSRPPYGLPSNVNVDGYSRVDATHFYLSFGGTANVPGLGTVQDEDVVFYNNGTWQLFFDGSTHGNLTANVDAISVKGGALYFSLSSSTVRPNGVTGPLDDSDIYRWAGGAAGSYTRAVDASTIGIPASANVDGFVWAGANDWLFSFSDNQTQTVTGLGGVQDEDVIRYTAGAWKVWFDGTAHGLGSSNNLDVDAFDIP